MHVELLSPAALEALTDRATIQRGADYLSAGAVGSLLAIDDKIRSTVSGSEVTLWERHGALVYRCTCPQAAGGTFCAHAVALGLAWLAQLATRGKATLRTPGQMIDDYLAAQSVESLRALVRDAAQRDEQFHQLLLLKSAQTNDDEAIEAFERAIDEATTIDRFIDWRDVGSFVAPIDHVIDSMEDLLTPDAAGVLIDLAEYAIVRVEGTQEQVHDDGEIGELVGRLRMLHLQACELAQPDPVALAERLFRMETTQQYGSHDFGPAAYRGALGQAGLQRYRELAEAEWRKNTSYNRYDITHIMEQLARVDGNIDELVAIKSRNLSSAQRYLNIATIWAEAGEADKALDWAQRGLAAFPVHTDNQLRDFLVAAYQQRQRYDEALQLTWIQFDEQPGLMFFQKLHAVAAPLGLWPAQRERALARLDDAIARDQAKPARRGPSGPDYSSRLAIALWEKDLDTAWAVAHQGACHRSLLLQLAGDLETLRPGDAVTLYRRVVPAIVEETNNAAYANAIGLIRRVGDLMNTQDQLSQFAAYLAELRAQFKPKRNFIKLLDEVACRAAAGR